MKLVAIAILLLVLGSGCSSPLLQPDPVLLAATDAGYPSLVFSACGKTWNGLGVCEVVKGDDLGAVKMTVQGVFDGMVKIDSKRCGIDSSMSYAASEVIQIPLKGLAVSDCVVTVTLEPVYPVKDASNVEIHDFRGSLALKVLAKKRTWTGDVRKLSGSWASFLDVPISDNASSAKVVATGCNVEVQNSMSPEQLWVTLDLAKMIKLSGNSSCILEGYVQQTNYVGRFNVYAAQYDSRYSMLPSPHVDINGSKLNVKADEAVSVMGLDGHFVISNEAAFPMEQTQAHTLILLTVQGRSIVGVWNIQSRQFEWKQ